MLNSCWVLEFLLRQPIRNHLLHNIFLLLPFPSPPPALPLRLLKTLLLRRIVSRPISDQTLLSLELIHRQNLTSNVYNASPLLLPLIQSAYLHAAVGSTLEPLRTGDLPDFFDAVTRVWTMRVGDLEASEDNGLVSEGLLEWKRKMEAAAAAAGSREARDEVLDGWRVEEGMAAVREYLVKELEVMGPTVLEMAAEAQLQGRNAGEVLGDVVNGDGAEGSGGQVERGEVGVSSNSKGIDNGDCVLIERGGEGEERNEGIVEQLEVGISSKGIDSGDCVVMEGGDGEASDGSGRGEERNGEQVERGDVDISLRGEERTGEQVERGEVDASLRGEERTGEQVERGEVDMGLRGVDTATSSGI